MKTAIAAALLICLFDSANAQTFYPNAITFGPAYAVGPPLGIPWWALPVEHAPLTIVGNVTSVGAPFADLLPPGPYELTVVYEGANGLNIEQFDGPCSGGTRWVFWGGTMTVYLDTSPDASFVDQSTFRDGTIVLFGQAYTTDISDNDPYESCPMVEDATDVLSSVELQGGTWFSRVNSNGVGFWAQSNGELTGHNPDNVPTELQALGYVLRIDGTMDIFGPVATRPTTWGHVKSLYR